VDGRVKPGHDTGEVAMLLHRFMLFAAITLATPASALDINSFRAQHKLSPLSVSSALLGAAYSHAADMASRKTLDYKRFRDGLLGTRQSDNVSKIRSA
jgi:hypothetical protein